MNELNLTFLCFIRKTYTVHLTLYWSTGSTHCLTTCRITFESLMLPTFLPWVLSRSISQSQICWFIKRESIKNWEATALCSHYFSWVQIQTWVYKILRWIWLFLNQQLQMGIVTEHIIFSHDEWSKQLVN